MAKTIKQSITHELVLALLYRLRLADDLFCQATDTVVSAVSIGDQSVKESAVTLLHDYSKALRVIHADFLLVMGSNRAEFPRDFEGWQWNEPDGESKVSFTLERLHAIAEGMQLKLEAKLLKEKLHS